MDKLEEGIAQPQLRWVPVALPGGSSLTVRAADATGADDEPVGGHVFVPSLGEYPVYDSPMYDMMVADEVRSRAYLDAIRAIVPGRTVVEVGTGQYALWSIAAARAGAEHVYAIEELPAYVESARRCVVEAGLADRITVVTGRSDSVCLPQRVDVCISEIIGCIGGSEGAAAVLVDVRERFLVDGGVSVPDRCVSTVAAATLEGAMPEGKPFLASETVSYLDLIFASTGGPFDFRLCLYGELAPVQLSGQAEIEDLQFNGDLRTEGTDDIELIIRRPGLLHGLVVGIRLSTAVGLAPVDTTTEETSWLPVFAPLSLEGIPVSEGDRVLAILRRTLSDDGVHPDYELSGDVEHRDGRTTEVSWNSPHHGGRLRSTSFYRELITSPTQAPVTQSAR